MHSLYFSHGNNFLKKILLIGLAIAIVTIGLTLTTNKRADAAAATCTWSGATSNLWSVAGNWSSCGDHTIPTNGDTIYFPSSAPNHTSVNDIVGLSLVQIRFVGSNYTLTGSSVSLSPTTLFALIFDGSGNDMGIDFSINASGERTIFSNDDNTISGDIALNITGGGFNTHVYPDKALTIDGAITGSVAGIYNTNGNPSTTVFNGVSTYTAGGVQISDGASVICGRHDCFGDSANIVTINGTGHLTFDMPFIDNDSRLDNEFVIEGGATIDAAEQSSAQLFGDLTLNGDGTIDGTGNITEYGTTDLGDNTLSMTGSFETGLWGKVTGEGNIICDACFTGMGPDAENDYEGTTEVKNNGRLYITSPYSLGTTDGNTTVEEGSTLEIGLLDTNIVPVAENVTISGAGQNGNIGVLRGYSPNNTFYSGTITLDGDATIEQDYDGLFEISGKITGEGNLTFMGDGDNADAHFDLTGSVANDYEGTTNITNIVVNLLGPNDVIAIPGDINIDSDGIPTQLIGQRDQKVADNSRITMSQNNASAILTIANGSFDTVGMIEGEGSVVVEDPNTTFNVGGGDLSGTFAGSFSSPGALIAKVGLGDWTLTGTINANGGEFPTFQVQAGKLLFNFSDTSGQFAPVILSSGTLGGSGVIGPLNFQQGNVSPGNSPGCLNPVGNVTMAASPSSLIVDLEGTDPCTGYDVFAASGNVDINGAELVLNTISSFTPPAGSTFEIVGGLTVTGTFNGLANNSIVTVGAYSYRINYTSTRVILTTLASDATAGSSSTLPVTGIAVGATIMTALSLLVAGLVLRRSTVICS